MVGHGHNLIVAATIISMIIGVWSVRSSRYVLNTGLGLVAAILVITLLVGLLDLSHLNFIPVLFMLAFFLITLKLASEQV